MPDLPLSSLMAAIFPTLMLGGLIVASLLRRDRFFSSYYFAYASASGRWSAPGKGYRT